MAKKPRLGNAGGVEGHGMEVTLPLSPLPPSFLSLFSPSSSSSPFFHRLPSAQYTDSPQKG